MTTEWFQWDSTAVKFQIIWEAGLTNVEEGSNVRSDAGKFLLEPCFPMLTVVNACNVRLWHAVVAQVMNDASNPTGRRQGQIVPVATLPCAAAQACPSISSRVSPGCRTAQDELQACGARG